MGLWYLPRRGPRAWACATMHGTPTKLVGSKRASIESRAPSLHGHADEVLTGLVSYDRAELDRLAASSAFGRIDT
jgi:hypothetical protein